MPTRGLGAFVVRLLCRMGRCTQCRLYETEDGIGGRCDGCGRVHGWVTRAELRASAPPWVRG